MLLCPYLYHFICGHASLLTLLFGMASWFKFGWVEHHLHAMGFYIFSIACLACPWNVVASTWLQSHLFEQSQSFSSLFLFGCMAWAHCVLLSANCQCVLSCSCLCGIVNSIQQSLSGDGFYLRICPDPARYPEEGRLGVVHICSYSFESSLLRVCPTLGHFRQVIQRRGGDPHHSAVGFVRQATFHESHPRWGVLRCSCEHEIWWSNTLPQGPIQFACCQPHRCHSCQQHCQAHIENRRLGSSWQG